MKPISILTENLRSVFFASIVGGMLFSPSSAQAYQVDGPGCPMALQSHIRAYRAAVLHDVTPSQFFNSVKVRHFKTACPSYWSQLQQEVGDIFAQNHAPNEGNGSGGNTGGGSNNGGGGNTGGGSNPGNGGGGSRPAL